MSEAGMSEAWGFWLRVFATALFDWGLAYSCGLLLAAHWLRRESPSRVQVPRLVLAACLMVSGLAAEFYLLVATMTDETSLLGALRSAGPVASTHAGAVTLWTLCVACVLVVVSWLWNGLGWTSAGLIVGILLLHSAMGHAARNGNFSWAELLQFFHLTSMALWTGGVIVAGLVIVPRMAAAGGVAQGYLRALSAVSTYSLGVVLVSGAFKGWDGLEGHLGGLLHTTWGKILLLKLVFVGIAIGLGALHRQWISRRSNEWTTGETKAMVRTLRLEAACLTLVILLSAWLGSVSPSGD